MRSTAVSLVFLAGFAGTALAEESRSEAAHVHGVSRLDIAIEGGLVAMSLTAPAADILGFEHEPRTEEEKKALAEARAKLGKPLTLFAPNAEADCAVRKATLSGAEEHDHHGHEKHAHQDHHGHGHDSHGHDSHGHDSHGHKDHGHKDHDHHEEHGGETHSDLSAEFEMTCSNAGDLRAFAFPYFKVFPNAEKVEIRLISKKGQFGYSVEKKSPSLDISGAL